MTTERSAFDDLPPAASQGGHEGKARATRRRFLTSGLIGGSVGLLAETHPISSLANTTNLRVCTYSGKLSGNLSQGPMNSCGGHSPGYYKEHTSHWPPGPSPGTCTGGGNSFCTSGTLFVTVFGTAPDAAFPAGTPASLMNCLRTPGSAAFHYAAAYLNAINPIFQGKNPSSGYDYPFTAAQIISYWQKNRAAGLALITQFENVP